MESLFTCDFKAKKNHTKIERFLVSKVQDKLGKIFATILQRMISLIY